MKLLYAAEKQRISILSLLSISKPRDLREKSGAERAVCIFRARRRGRRQKERQKLQDAVIVNILQQTLQQGLCSNRLFVRLTACERAVSRSMMPLCLQETAGPAEQSTRITAKHLCGSIANQSSLHPCLTRLDL